MTEVECTTVQHMKLKCFTLTLSSRFLETLNQELLNTLSLE